MSAVGDDADGVHRVVGLHHRLADGARRGARRGQDVAVLGRASYSPPCLRLSKGYFFGLFSSLAEAFGRATPPTQMMLGPI